MKGHEHFITCSIVVSKYLVPDRDSNRQRSHRFEGRSGHAIGKRRRNEGEKRERERIFSPKRKLTRRDLSEISKLRGREIERKRERGKDCGETISHAFGKGGIADERKGGQRFDGGLLGTVRRPFGSTGSGTTW